MIYVAGTDGECALFFLLFPPFFLLSLSFPLGLRMIVLHRLFIAVGVLWYFSWFRSRQGWTECQ